MNSISILDYVKKPDYLDMPLPPDPIDIALPKHLWGKKHDDWPIKKDTPRGTTSDGPRAIRTQGGIHHPKYLATPPKLVKGYGLARWMAICDQSVLEIPLFNNKKMMTEAHIPDVVEGYERKPGTPLYNQRVRLPKKVFLKFYGPSSLQKFSEQSCAVRDPYHKHFHRMIWKREEVGKTKEKTGADWVFFWRWGARWDSLDNYYSTRSALGPAFYCGMRWN